MIMIGVVALILNPSMSEAITISGQGYGIVSKNLQKASLVIPDKLVQDSSSARMDGKLILNEKSYVLKNIDYTISAKKISLTADAGYFLIKASGKLLANSSDASIYQLSAKTSKGDSFFVLARVSEDLKPSKVSIQEPKASTETKIIKKDLLLLVKQTERVDWKSEYKFTVRVFEPKLNPISDFYKTDGYVENIRITGKILNSDGELIKTFNGTTQKFGYFLDSLIIPDNARTGNYKLEVIASGDGYNQVVKQFDFFVNPAYRGPTATP